MKGKYKLNKLFLSIIIIIIFNFVSSCNSNTNSIKIEKTFEWNGYETLDYSFINQEKEKTEFYLLQPDNPANSPLVILIHGYKQSKDAWLGDKFTHGELVTEKLLEQGASVLLVDLPFHGSHYNENINLDESIWPPSKYPVFIQMFIDDVQIILNNLAEKTEINTTRIAVVGYSLGSSVSFPLIDIIPEVDAAVLCVPIPFLNNRSDVGPMKSAGKINIPIMFISASKDRDEIVNDIPFIFNVIPSKIKEQKWYDSSHNLPIEYSKDVIDWLDNNFFND